MYRHSRTQETCTDVLGLSLFETNALNYTAFGCNFPAALFFAEQEILPPERRAPIQPAHLSSSPFQPVA